MDRCQRTPTSCGLKDVFYNPLRIADKNTTQLATLQLSVRVRGEQLADPEMGSVLTLFRRAANVIARLEDALVFNGFVGYDPDYPGNAGNPALPYNSPNAGEQIWGGKAAGLLISPTNGRPNANPKRAILRSTTTATSGGQSSPSHW